MTFEPFEFLNSPKTIRERCNQLFYLLGLEGRLEHFRIREDRLPISVDLVKDEILANYPDLNIPLIADGNILMSEERIIGLPISLKFEMIEISC